MFHAWYANRRFSGYASVERASACLGATRLVRYDMIVVLGLGPQSSHDVAER